MILKLYRAKIGYTGAYPAGEIDKERASIAAKLNELAEGACAGRLLLGRVVKKIMHHEEVCYADLMAIMEGMAGREKELRESGGGR